MSTRTKEELSGISLLGDQRTKYPQDYVAIPADIVRYEKCISDLQIP